MDKKTSQKDSELESLDKKATQIGIGGHSKPVKTEDDYRKRMLNRKEVQRKRIEKRDKEKGLIIVFTGHGKGKTTAALGMALRTLGHQERVAIIQFIKGGWMPGEAKALQVFGDKLAWHALGEGFTWETQDRERDKQFVTKAWEKSKSYLKSKDHKLVILDEINVALKLGYIELNDVIEGLSQRPPLSHVVLTGRNAPNALIDIADLVTEMNLIHHPFKEKGVKAQPGIEF